MDRYLGALGAIDRLDQRRKEIAADARYTPTGQKEEAEKFVFSELVPEFYKGRLEIRKAKREAADRRARLQPPKADPTDMAAALRRWELR
jgi:hypothetical protein